MSSLDITFPSTAKTESGEKESVIGGSIKLSPLRKNTITYPLYSQVLKLIQQPSPRENSPRSTIYKKARGYFKYALKGSKLSLSPKAIEHKAFLGKNTGLIRQISKSLSILLEPVFKHTEGEAHKEAVFPYLFELKNLKKNIYSILEGAELLINTQKFTLGFSTERVSIDNALLNLLGSSKINKKLKKHKTLQTFFLQIINKSKTEREKYYKELKITKSNEHILGGELKEKLSQLATKNTAALNAIALETISPKEKEKKIQNIDHSYEEECKSIKDRYLKKFVIDKLIQKITPHITLEEEKAWSMTTPKKLLAVYRYFMTTEDLFYFIRLSIQNPKLCSSQKRVLIHLCRTWLKDPWNLDHLCNESAIKQIESIITATYAEITLLLEKKEQTDELLEEQVTALEKVLDTVKKQNRATVFGIQQNEKILFDTFEKLTIFSNLDDLSLKKLLESYQQQLYWMAARVFANVHPRELIYFNVEKDEVEKSFYCSNLKKYHELHNKLTSFIVQDICYMINDEQETKIRYKFYCKLGYLAIQNHDYFSVMSIAAALSNSCVAKVVKELKIPYSSEKAAIDLLSDTDKNQAQLRQAQENHPKDTIIPFLGIHQKDITFFKEGNSDIKDNHKENWSLEFDTARINNIYKIMETLDNFKARLIVKGLPPPSPLEIAIVKCEPLDPLLEDLLYKKACSLAEKPTKPKKKGILASGSLGSYFTISRKTGKKIKGLPEV